MAVFMESAREDVMSEQTIEYPVSDGEPMAETDAHADEMRHYCIDVLREHFATRQPTYVSGNNFVYYREGDPRACVSPDTYVVRGVAQRLRDTFKVWEEEGRRPCFVLELTSRKTQAEDRGAKRGRYERDLAVPEYFLFDLRGDWIPERLVGHRLVRGRYRPIASDARGRLASAELGLELAVADGHLRFFEPGAATPLPTAHEIVLAARDRATRAEDELARLRAELERLRRP
jgi:Uma2 family endonuclease